MEHANRRPGRGPVRASMEPAVPLSKRRTAPLRLPALGALALGLLALVACHSTSPKVRPPYVVEIEAQNRALEELFRAGNLLGVADLYADDAVLVNSGGERTQGRQEIDEYWSAIENPVDWRLDIRRILGSEQVAYELGTSHLTTRRDGALRTSVNDFLVLWQRASGGEWRIAVDAYWPTPAK